MATGRAQFFLPPVSDLLIWLDAMDSSRVSFNPTTRVVSSWASRAGPAGTGTASASGVTLVSNGINGRQSIQIATPSIIQGSLSYSGSAFHVFYVVQLTSASAIGSPRVLSLGNTTNNDWQNDNSAFIILESSLAKIGRNNVEASVSATPDAPILVQASLGAGNLNIGKFGEGTGSSNNAASSANLGVTTWTIGRQGISDAGSAFAGFVGEILVFNRVLNLGERQSVELYLTRKWGLAAAIQVVNPQHPVALRPTAVVPAPIPFSRFFSPTSVSGCALWFDGTDPAGNGVIPADGASISSWVDKSGNTRNGTLIGGTTAPVFRRGLINGVAGLDFSSGGGYTTAAFTNTVSATLFVVCVVLSGISSSGNFFHHGHRDNDISLERAWATNFIQWQTKDDANVQIAITFNEPTIYVATIANSLVRNLWDIDRTGTVTVNRTDTGPSLTTGSKIAYIGRSDWTTPEPCNSWIGEIIYYNSELSATDRASIESYLANKWRLERGLANNHQHFTRPAGRSAVIPLVEAPIIRSLTPIAAVDVFNAVRGVDFTISRMSGRIFYMFYNFTKTMVFLTRVPLNVEIFMVGGGGGGAANGGAGGGGAGGLRNFTTLLSPGSYDVIVGAGGAAATNGNNTSFGSFNPALGGGRGGARTNQAGADGGCGGGAGSDYGAVGIGSQGGNGGSATTQNISGGAGGGIGGNGTQNRGAPTVPSNGRPSGFDGGPGLQYYGTWYGGGGGGGRWTNEGYGGLGGIGGGGRGGGQDGLVAQAGVNGTGGGGGGGAGNAGDVRNGGSGICIISWVG